MRVFVTGATGFVGSAVVNELIAAGHKVEGLARSDERAAALAKTGATVRRGTLEDLDGLRSGARASDGVIHTAFNHDFTKFAENSETDRRAIEALGDGLEGTDRPLLVTSGVGMLSLGRLATEDDVPTASPSPRVSEAAAMAQVARGVHASIIRLPPSVHGKGDHGFVPNLIGLAREKGAAAYVGANRWPAVHRLDAAKAYRLALEHGATGMRYHVLDEEAVPFKDIAGTIGRKLNVPVLARTPENAAEYFGWFAMFAAMDVPASSAKTRAMLNWKPTQPGLLADMDANYFG